MDPAQTTHVYASWQSPEDGATVHYAAEMRLDRLAQLIDLMDRGEDPPEDDE